ncbi:MAG: pyroglutamyl-peptidase I family protein, partial [Bdellovibrionota bacterium]
LVLSLGEGDCEIHVETLARNLDNTPHLPDNAGETRASKTIDPTLPARVTFSYPAAALSRAMAGSRLSKNMGNFVCNNTAFRLGTKFHGSQIQYGFIHVPPASCGKISDPERVGLNLTQSIISVNPFP